MPNRLFFPDRLRLELPEGVRPPPGPVIAAAGDDDVDTDDNATTERLALFNELAWTLLGVGLGVRGVPTYHSIGSGHPLFPHAPDGYWLAQLADWELKLFFIRCPRPHSVVPAAYQIRISAIRRALRAFGQDTLLADLTRNGSWHIVSAIMHGPEGIIQPDEAELRAMAEALFL